MNPYDPHELDRLDPELDRVAGELEEHAAAVRGEPPLDLASRVWAAIENEPLPASRWAWLAGLRRPARGLAAAAILVAAVTGALAIGSLIDDARPDVGGPSAPAVLPSPSATPVVQPTASPTASPSPTVTPSATPSADDDEVESPEPSESEEDNSGPGGGDEVETPEPSESDTDNSGPGGGGGDNSGPGGG